MRGPVRLCDAVRAPGFSTAKHFIKCTSTIRDYKARLSGPAATSSASARTSLYQHVRRFLVVSGPKLIEWCAGGEPADAVDGTGCKSKIVTFCPRPGYRSRLHRVVSATASPAASTCCVERRSGTSSFHATVPQVLTAWTIHLIITFLRCMFGEWAGPWGLRVLLVCGRATVELQQHKTALSSGGAGSVVGNCVA